MFQILDLASAYPWLMPLLIIWTIPWKGYALWKAAKAGSKVWFVVFLVANTIGLLEILYIFIFSKRGKKQPEPALAQHHESMKHDQGATINYEYFQKIHLRVARILDADRVVGSEKLIKLQLDLGDEERQIVAGIGKAYAPENLKGREIVIVANLEPRSLMGIQSQGMLLAASIGDLPTLLMPEKEVAPGSKIQ